MSSNTNRLDSNWLMETIIRICNVVYFSINPSRTRVFLFSLFYYLLIFFKFLRSSLLSFAYCSFAFYHFRVHACKHACVVCVWMSESVSVPNQIESEINNRLFIMWLYGAITITIIIIICTVSKFSDNPIFFSCSFIHVMCIKIASVYSIYNTNTRTVIKIKLKWKIHNNQNGEKKSRKRLWWWRFFFFMILLKLDFTPHSYEWNFFCLLF